MTEENDLEGLGGWLILVAIGIVFSPIRILFVTIPIYSEIFSTGSWEILTTPGADAYNPLWGPIIIGEILVNGALIMVWLYIAYLFFTKNRVFPIFYIGIILFTLILVIVDAFSIALVLPDEPIFDLETSTELVRSIVACILWVPYMLISKRVKATFRE